MPKTKEGARRCFDLTQDLNWHGHSDKFWRKFKEKYPQYKDIPNKELKDTMDAFWRYCGNVLVETPHGIVLDRIGYLANTVYDYPKNMVHDKRTDEIYVNYVADGDVYRCSFYPICPEQSAFKNWMFTLNKGYKKRMKELIQDGMKYRNHIEFLSRNNKAAKSY